MKQILTLLLVLATGIIQAQDIFQTKRFSADNIMEMREKINLTDAQAAKIKKIHSENAGQFSTLKWDLDEETKKLQKLLEAPKIDPVAVNKQLDVVLSIESQLKKKQLGALVAIKNELTEEQKKIISQNTVLAVRGVAATAPVKIVEGVPLATSPSGTAASSPKVAVSINGNGEQPLYFIQTKSGLQKVFSLESIDPKDIESMSVFKGDQALEKYGVEGKNGVIVITLKQTPDEFPLEN